MSAPAGGSNSGSPSGGAGGRDQQTLSRFMRRASKALRPKSTPSRGEPSSSASESRAVSGARPTPSATASRPTASASAGGAAPSAPPASVIVNSAAAYLRLREEKARALFAKYGMTLESTEWTASAFPAARTDGAEWIEKRIVMRVHRQCHRCQNSFGAEKLCTSCGHTRCKKCPRYPVKRTRAGDQPVTKDAALRDLLVDPAYNQRAKSEPLSLSRGEGKRDAVRRHPVHRVRRTCHKCDALFKGQAKNCQSCGHPRCPSCPRDPPKTKKYPNGYPGDTEETFPLVQRVPKQIRHRFRWECHQCQNVFIEHEKTCRGCHHERCDQCTRKPPKKVKKTLDSEAVKSVEDRLKGMTIEGDPDPEAQRAVSAVAAGGGRGGME